MDRPAACLLRLANRDAASASRRGPLSTERTNAPAWRGDWRARIEARFGERGFRDVREFLRAHPSHSYSELADILSINDDVAPVQLQALHKESAKDLRTGALDSLGRFLKDALGRGWGGGRYWESRVMGALASWSATWDRPDETQRVKRELFASAPTVGWRPAPNDPFLAALFDRVWPGGE